MVFNCKWVIKYALGFIAILKLDIRTYDVCETKPRTMNLAGFVSNSISDFSFIIVLNLSANVPCPHDVPTLLWTLQMIVKQIRSDIFTSISIKITTVKSQVYFIYWIFHIQSSSGRINAISLQIICSSASLLFRCYSSKYLYSALSIDEIPCKK